VRGRWRYHRDRANAQSTCVRPGVGSFQTPYGAGDPAARPRVRISQVEDAQELRRAWLGGYRRADVDKALARGATERDPVPTALAAATQRANAMQLEIRDLHDRIDRLRQSESSLTRSLDLMRNRREQMDREARHRAQQLVLEAEERTAQLKVEGLRQ